MVASKGGGGTASPAPKGKQLSDQADQARKRSRQLHDRAGDALQHSDEVLSTVAGSFGDGSQYRETIRALQTELAGLREAMASRAVIEQAKGIIMAREGCSADEAFRILVKSSQREHLKVRELAQQLILRVDQDQLRRA